MTFDNYSAFDWRASAIPALVLIPAGIIFLLRSFYARSKWAKKATSTPVLVYFALLISVYCCGVEYNYERCTFSASRLENTKILWRDLMVVFEDIGLDVWADAGTAMQAARNDPDFSPWDTDTDFATEYKDAEWLETLLDALKAGIQRDDLFPGLDLTIMYIYNRGFIQVLNEADDAHMDLFLWRRVTDENGKEWLLDEDYLVPDAVKYLDPVVVYPIKKDNTWLGIRTPLANDAEQLAYLYYGSGWRTPMYSTRACLNNILFKRASNVRRALYVVFILSSVLATLFVFKRGCFARKNKAAIARKGRYTSVSGISMSDMSV